MILPSIALVAIALAQSCLAQQAGWDPGQINSTMCQWLYPRAAVIRDTLYIDGGNLYWQPGMSDGSFGEIIADGNPLGLVYLLNFSSPFNTSQNTTKLFTTISKAPNGGSVNNLGPQYYDGGMFANDYEFTLYGGVPQLTDAYNAQPSDSVAAYQAYPQGVKQFTQGYILDTLPPGMTRYVTNGASVSVPSENLGFYFGGTRAASWGPIYYLPGSKNGSLIADQLSSTMMAVDMSTQYKESWKNYTLPTAVPGRADPEIVWVPVSKQGVLVAIGGVIHPSYLNPNQTNNASATADSKTVSPGFMTTVSVYDIANQVWYVQPTSGSAPGQLAQGCTVLASALDGSSHNIYWYGGFDGLNAAGSFNDDVYVLSIPSFVWTKVYTSSNQNHGRAGHRCTKTYPDQMLVIGGYSSQSGEGIRCVEGGIIQIYNLSSNTWLNSYDPRVWSNYSVPPAVYGAIGGSATGGATKTSPSPGGFANSSMASLFGTPYSTSKITNWYPYAYVSSTSTPSALPTNIVPVASSGTPSFLAPVLGVVLGLFFITLIILAIMLWRRRKYLRDSTAAQSEAGTIDNRRWVDRWLSGTAAGAATGAAAVDAKAPTVTTEESDPMTPLEQHPSMPEMDQGTERYEMDATPAPIELSNQQMQDTGTGLHPLPILSAARGIQHSNSVTSYKSDGSSISGTSSRPHISPINSPNDSPHDSPHITDTRIVSGISNMSETDRGHLRGISETSVSSAGDHPSPLEANLRQGSNQSPTAIEGPSSLVSPVTPPVASGPEGRDFLDGRMSHATKERRRSNFSEGLD